MAGIVGYGAYVPMYRIKVHEIAKIWGEEGERVEKSLGIKEKSVPDIDEDSATISVEAARRAVYNAGIAAVDIEAVFVGSESKPYAVKPTATMVAEAIGATPVLTAADMEFACKAGTAAMQCCMGMCMSGMIDYGLAIGADTSQGRPGDALEYSAGAGGAAFIIGRDGLIAEIEGTYSFTTDTPDFWRRAHSEFPSHGGRFTGEPAYFKHITSATRGLMEQLGLKVSDFDYAVFHQPNGKFPLEVAKMLGFEAKKVEPGLFSPVIGNTYSAASMIGLAGVLDVAKPGERILMTSFGSGAGSDAFSIKTTDLVTQKKRLETLRHEIENKTYLDYGMYVKHRRKLKSL
ncbi:MAG: hydroxymethylglutaryl-CoA synthase [Candidatus Micrarchaeota archaeon]|nr:hydroxymethylglutaryl-CoA synthase [Candidatus Micrarchaeota archaeon]